MKKYFRKKLKFWKQVFIMVAKEIIIPPKIGSILAFIDKMKSAFKIKKLF